MNKSTIIQVLIDQVLMDKKRPWLFYLINFTNHNPGKIYDELEKSFLRSETEK